MDAIPLQDLTRSITGYEREVREASQNSDLDM